MTDADTAVTSRRPALRKLTHDLQSLRGELREGFESRQAVLDWLHRLTVRTLGQVPTRRYRQLAADFVPDAQAREGVVLAALLTPEARTRELDADVEHVREQIAARTIGFARHPAFRSLRKDAGEYVGESDEAGDEGHAPEVQRYIAMRPAFDEIESDQQQVLQAALDGFDDRGSILEWGDTLELATHGEPVTAGDRSFSTRCYEEDSTVELLTSQQRAYVRAREAFAARFLLPAFNRGVQDLAGKAAEEPAEQDTGPAGFTEV